MVRHTPLNALNHNSLPSDYTASLGKYEGLLKQYRESMGVYDAGDSSSESAATYATNHRRVNTYIIFIFIVEFLIMVFVAILEYFLRWTSAFPVREQNFSCVDPSISYAADSEQMFSHFALEAQVSEAFMLGACFLIPIIMIGIGESALWLLNAKENKIVYAMCKQFKLPQMFRRMLRFVGVHLYGCFATMVVTDVTKIMTGAFRPNFLSICKPFKNCTSDNVGIEVCTQKNIVMLRDARLSFPSLHASVTSFAAVFTSVYIHNSINTHQVRLLRPFFTLSLIIAALLAGLSRMGHHRNHWQDILAGYAIGTAVGFYLSIMILNRFSENQEDRELSKKIQKIVDKEDPYTSCEEYDTKSLNRSGKFEVLTAENLLREEIYQEPPIPKITKESKAGPSRAPGHSRNFSPSQNCSPRSPKLKKAPARNNTRSPPNAKRAYWKNTFQRDLEKTVDQLRKERYGSLRYKTT